MTHRESISSYMRRPLAGAGRHNEINTSRRKTMSGTGERVVPVGWRGDHP